jgi:hypothetical protein
VLRGELSEAIEEETPRFSALARLGAEMPAWHEAVREVARRRADEDGDCAALADALRRMGWVDESIALLRPGVRANPGSEPGSRLLVQLFAQRQLEAELKVLALETYRTFADGGAVPDFDRFCERMGAASNRALGHDLAKESSTLSFWPIGSLLDPTTESGLPAWFRRSGRLLVAGQRRGRPPELLLTSLVATGVAGPQHAQLYFVDGTLIPGWLEHQGARFSGAALDRFVYVDVGAVEDDVARILALDRRLGGERERVLADPVQLAADARARTSIVEPAEVATKLELRALAEWREHDPRQERAQLLAEALDGVIAHETGHLEDAVRFLPLSTHVWSHLGDLLRLGFSPRRIEEWLEMRAECVALARARNPHLVLGACVGQQAGSSTLTPHGGGYQELLERLVEKLDDAPEDFPELDRTKVLVQQLDLLSADQIRLAARRVLSDLGID